VCSSDLVKQIAAFYESLKKGEPPEITGASALVTQRLINGIYDGAGRIESFLT
jgi:predicted dehydrogenase